MSGVILDMREDGIVGDRMKIREDKELLIVMDKKIKELSEEGERRISDNNISRLVKIGEGWITKVTRGSGGNSMRNSIILKDIRWSGKSEREEGMEFGEIIRYSNKAF